MAFSDPDAKSAVKSPCEDTATAKAVLGAEKIPHKDRVALRCVLFDEDEDDEDDGDEDNDDGDDDSDEDAVHKRVRVT